MSDTAPQRQINIDSLASEAQAELQDAREQLRAAQERVAYLQGGLDMLIRIAQTAQGAVKTEGDG